MYTAGKLLYFDPFYFKDGGSKRKYFLVLKIIGNNAILACLPSSQLHLPVNQEIVHGCLEIVDSCIGCYIFKAAIPITKAGWSFEFDTILYGSWLDDFNVDELNEKYSIENVDYEIIGEVSDEEMKNVIECFMKSNVVKRKYKRLLAK